MQVQLLAVQQPAIEGQLVKESWFSCSAGNKGETVELCPETNSKDFA